MSNENLISGGLRLLTPDNTISQTAIGAAHYACDNACIGFSNLQVAGCLLFSAVGAALNLTYHTLISLPFFVVFDICSGKGVSAAWADANGDIDAATRSFFLMVSSVILAAASLIYPRAATYLNPNPVAISHSEVKSPAEHRLEVERETSQLTIETERLRREKERLDNEKQQLQINLGVLQHQVTQLEDDVTNAKTIDALVDEHKKLKRELTQGSDRIEKDNDLNQRLANIESNIQDLIDLNTNDEKTEIIKFENLIEQIVVDMGTLKETLNARAPDPRPSILDFDFSPNNEENSDPVAHFENLLTAIKADKEKIEQLERLQTEHVETIQELEGKQESLNQEKADLEHTLEELQNDKTNLETQLNTVTIEKEDSVNQVNALQDQLNNLKERENQLMTELNKVTEEKNELDEELTKQMETNQLLNDKVNNYNEMMNKLDEAKKEIQDLTLENATLKIELEEMEEKNNSPAHIEQNGHVADNHNYANDNEKKNQIES